MHPSLTKLAMRSWMGVGRGLCACGRCMGASSLGLQMRQHGTALASESSVSAPGKRMGNGPLALYRSCTGAPLVLTWYASGTGLAVQTYGAHTQLGEVLGHVGSDRGRLS